MKTKNNIVTEGLSGKINKLVFRQRFGETVVAKAPKRTGISSTAQLGIRQLFKEAVIYAKASLADMATRLAYKAKAKPGQTAFNMALADFFKPPVISDIDTGNYTGIVGSSITIAASDDFKVVSVRVRIETATGNLVEDGMATLSGDGLHWLYASSTNSGNVSGYVVIVTATDLPGHSIVKQKTI